MPVRGKIYEADQRTNRTCRLGDGNQHNRASMPQLKYRSQASSPAYYLDSEFQALDTERCDTLFLVSGVRKSISTSRLFGDLSSSRVQLAYPVARVFCSRHLQRDRASCMYGADTKVPVYGVLRAEYSVYAYA